MQFRNPEHQRVAARLGLTPQALQDCLRANSLEQANQNLNGLKAQVKANYKKLVFELHPDRNPDKLEEFKGLNAAYDEISKTLERLHITPRRPRPVPQPNVVFINCNIDNQTSSTVGGFGGPMPFHTVHINFDSIFNSFNRTR